MSLKLKHQQYKMWHKRAKNSHAPTGVIMRVLGQFKSSSQRQGLLSVLAKLAIQYMDYRYQRNEAFEIEPRKRVSSEHIPLNVLRRTMTLILTRHRRFTECGENV